MINKKAAKIKRVDSNKPDKFKVKIQVLAKDSTTNKYEAEHCEITFITEEDREGFIQVFSEKAEIISIP